MPFPLIAAGLAAGGIGALGKLGTSLLMPSKTGFDSGQINDVFNQSYRTGSTAINRRMGVANQDAASTLSASGLGDSGALARFIGLNAGESSEAIAKLLAQLTADKTSALQQNATVNAQLKQNKMGAIGDVFGDIGDIGSLLSILGLQPPSPGMEG